MKGCKFTSERYKTGICVGEFITGYFGKKLHDLIAFLIRPFYPENSIYEIRFKK